MTPEELKKRQAFLLSQQQRLTNELNKLAEMEKLAAAQEPLKIIIVDIASTSPERLLLKMSRYDESLLIILRSIYTRVYHGGDEHLNSIQVNKFDELKQKLADAKVELIYSSPEVEKRVTELVDRPDFVVT